MTCIDDYKERTKVSRTQNETNIFFLSLKKTHKPVSKSTLTKWIIKTLNLSGIDVSKFKAHSVRSPSSSKVTSLGLQIKDVLSMGN